MVQPHFPIDVRRAYSIVSNKPARRPCWLAYTSRLSLDLSIRRSRSQGLLANRLNCCKVFCEPSMLEFIIGNNSFAKRIASLIFFGQADDPPHSSSSNDLSNQISQHLAIFESKTGVLLPDQPESHCHWNTSWQKVDQRSHCHLDLSIHF